MINIVVAIFFVIISFITWLSISFKIAGNFIDDDVIFSRQSSAIIFYFINCIIAIIVTIFCYILVCRVQRL